ncbi:MAG TPA: cation:dicarboxylase symporter family transporter, partial [Vicinamibacterales bacterium]|nr:cation:dicarboxylase symporter family transporter [Vicinamibacterales bacterium]
MPKLLGALLITITLAAVIAVLDFIGITVNPTVAFASRWLAIAALCAFAAQRRSLTIWILVSMVIGAEVGHDFPEVAMGLRVLAQIFLRLIRTIVAPLLFATLVVGIAGHSNLKQVGRMGVKALIYFEVVTTIALFIGWAAISFSQAGVGINLPPSPDAAQLGTPTQ